MPNLLDIWWDSSRRSPNIPFCSVEYPLRPSQGLFACCRHKDCCVRKFPVVDGAAMWQFVLLLMVNVTSGEKCFHCGDDRSPGCTDRMSYLGVSDSICINRGSCVKFNGTAIIPPGQFASLQCYLSTVYDIGFSTPLGVNTPNFRTNPRLPLLILPPNIVHTGYCLI